MSHKALTCRGWWIHLPSPNVVTFQNQVTPCWRMFGIPKIESSMPRLWGYEA